MMRYYDFLRWPVVGKLSAAFPNKYYCLVSGLVEYGLEMAGASGSAGSAGASGVGVNWGELRDEVRAGTAASSSDGHAVELLYTYYDIQNLLGVVRGGVGSVGSVGSGLDNVPFSELGNLSREQIMAEVERAPQMDVDAVDYGRFVSQLPGALALVMDRFVVNRDRAGSSSASSDVEDVEAAGSVVGPRDFGELEREMYSVYYVMCGRSGCAFLAKWADVDRTVRNVVAVSTARKLGMDARDMVIGDSQFEQLLLSTANLSLLKEEFVWMEPLLAVVAESDFVEREHKMDELRWKIVDTINEQSYFTIGVLLGYLIKLNIIQRWVALDKDSGRKRFRGLVEALKCGVVDVAP